MNFSSLRPEARWYLLHAALLTGGLGIGALLYNLTIDALGYERIFLGQLETVARLTALLLLLPLWWLVGVIGLRQALLLSAGLQAGSALTLALWPESVPLLLASAVTGPAAVLFQVSAAPLMMAYSSPRERDLLFSLNAALNIGVAGLSKWFGGSAPGLLANLLGLAPESAPAYRATFGLAALLLLAALAPLLRMPAREPAAERESTHQPAPAEQPVEVVPAHPLLATLAERLPEPWRSLVRSPGMVIRLLIPPLLISCGAALLIPYLNLFLAGRHAAGTAGIGLILAAADVAAGLAMLAAPLLSSRVGKVRSIVWSQLASIPFLLLAGFTPVLMLAGGALVVRNALFNMGVPLYDAFAMERSPPAARPVVIGLVNGAYAAGYFVAPLISTSIQQRYGFGPLFIATACFYGLGAAALYLLFREQKR